MVQTVNLKISRIKRSQTVWWTLLALKETIQRYGSPAHAQWFKDDGQTDPNLEQNMM